MGLAMKAEYTDSARGEEGTVVRSVPGVCDQPFSTTPVQGLGASINV